MWPLEQGSNSSSRSPTGRGRLAIQVSDLTSTLVKAHLERPTSLWQTFSQICSWQVARESVFLLLFIWISLKGLNVFLIWREQPAEKRDKANIVGKFVTFVPQQWWITWHLFKSQNTWLCIDCARQSNMERECVLYWVCDAVNSVCVVIVPTNRQLICCCGFVVLCHLL